MTLQRQIFPLFAMCFLSGIVCACGDDGGSDEATVSFNNSIKKNSEANPNIANNAINAELVATGTDPVTGQVIGIYQASAFQALNKSVVGINGDDQIGIIQSQSVQRSYFGGIVFANLSIDGINCVNYYPTNTNSALPTIVVVGATEEQKVSIGNEYAALGNLVIFVDSLDAWNGLNTQLARLESTLNVRVDDNNITLTSSIQG